MQNLLSETSGNLDDLDLTDSQMNQFFKQMQSPFPIQPQPQSDLQTLIQNTLFLDYDIFLAHEDLRFYRTLLAEKDQEVKRVKEKITKKNAKVGALADELAKKEKKIGEVKEGYEKLKIKLAAASDNEGKKREQRLEEQQKKVVLFQQCQQLGETCASLMLQLEDYKQTQYEAAQIRTENEQLRQQVEEFYERREIGGDGTLSQRKEQLRSEVRRLYQKIKLAQKEDESICQEYQSNRRVLGDLQRQQDTLNAKNVEIEGLYSRISRLKEQVQSKRWEITTRQRQLFELSREEGQLRRTAKESPSSPPLLGQNFRIIDSEADEDLSKTGQRLIGHYQSCSLESQEQLDQLISRFQKIKSRGKQ